MTLVLVAMSYFACASVATFPVVLTFGSELPGQLTDPLEHLWIMRWSKACLLEGRSPLFCPSINYPTGVPFGYFPSMHLHSLAYVGLSSFVNNDVACFNVLWFFGFVSTGVSSFLLGWWTVRKFWPAWLAGFGAMLCGPMLMHAHGHLETMQMGAVPIFLIGWLRFVDRPGVGRLAISSGLYLLVAASAPYFAVLAVFPAVWYVGCSMVTAGAGQRRGWLVGRSKWLVGFGLLVLPGLAALFSSQIWSASHGFAMARTRSQFNQFGAPPWSSFVPSPLHLFGRSLGQEVFASTGYSSRMSECSSYLGVVTLALLAYAMIRRVRFPRMGFWWSALALMVVLSWGSQLPLGSTRISLPAGWLYGIFPPFHLIRVPARFNLFAAICAVVPASAALSDLLGRIHGRMARVSIVVGLGLLMMLDLSMVPFETSPIPPMPEIYSTLSARNKDVAVVDAPVFGSNEGQVFSSLWEYWQSIHGLKTTAGYPGLTNATFEAEIVRPSPFWASRLLDTDYLKEESEANFGPVAGVNIREYVWLYLNAHKFDHVIFHRGPWFDAKYAIGSSRLQALLAEARSFEDADTVIFDRARLRPPDHLTWLCAEGFRPALARSDRAWFGVLRSARLVVINPTPDRQVIISLGEVSAFEHPRTIRLVGGEHELARWTVERGDPRTLETPPLKLAPGLRELRFLSDGDDPPTRHADRLDDARTPYSWKLETVRVRHSD